MFFRIKLAGGGVTSVWQAPELFGVPGSCVELIEIRQILVVFAMNAVDL